MHLCSRHKTIQGVGQSPKKIDGNNAYIFQIKCNCIAKSNPGFNKLRIVMKKSGAIAIGKVITDTF